MVGDAQDVEAAPPVQVDELGDGEGAVAPACVRVELAEERARTPSHLSWIVGMRAAARMWRKVVHFQGKDVARRPRPAAGYPRAMPSLVAGAEERLQTARPRPQRRLVGRERRGDRREPAPARRRPSSRYSDALADRDLFAEIEAAPRTRRRRAPARAAPKPHAPAPDPRRAALRRSSSSSRRSRPASRATAARSAARRSTTTRSSGSCARATTSRSAARRGRRRRRSAPRSRTTCASWRGSATRPPAPSGSATGSRSRSRVDEMSEERLIRTLADADTRDRGALRALEGRARRPARRAVRLRRERAAAVALRGPVLPGAAAGGRGQPRSAVRGEGHRRARAAHVRGDRPRGRRDHPAQRPLPAARQVPARLLHRRRPQRRRARSSRT